MPGPHTAPMPGPYTAPCIRMPLAVCGSEDPLSSHCPLHSHAARSLRMARACQMTLRRLLRRKSGRTCWGRPHNPQSHPARSARR
eukprot:194678-Chlamydomonas_euryale.AAC.1